MPKKHVIDEQRQAQTEELLLQAGPTQRYRTPVNSLDLDTSLPYFIPFRAEDLKLEWKQRKERMKESDVDLDVEFSDEDKRRYKEKVG